jgi:hypothetical protein
MSPPDQKTDSASPKGHRIAIRRTVFRLVATLAVPDRNRNDSVRHPFVPMQPRGPKGDQDTSLEHPPKPFPPRDGTGISLPRGSTTPRV